jgi:hypothetical protein
MSAPHAQEYNPYYQRYIGLVPQGDIIQVLESQWPETRSLLSSIPETRGTYRYEPGKWSIKEMVGHMIDTERIFAYRALCIARGDKTPLPGFEQDDYVRGANFDAASLKVQVEEFSFVRHANVMMFKGLQPEVWTRTGTASGNPVTVRALAWIIAGHELHHRAVLKEKYLK